VASAEDAPVAVASAADADSNDNIMDDTSHIVLLEKHGIKPTANRILIARTMDTAGRPLSLSEIETKLLTVDKSVISRTLSLFREQHMVHVIEDGGDGVRYELCRSHDQDHDDDMHVHFYCEQCQRTYCLDGIKIPPVQLSGGFVMNSVNYMIKGICPNCRD
jgi:Fur family ferric uptake transcriptional regulator